jgi:hypothetical protein
VNRLRTRQDAPLSPPGAAAGHGSPEGSPAARWGRRFLGAAIVLLAVAPFHRLLDSPRTGVAGSVTVSLMDIQLEFVWFGLMLAAAVFAAGSSFFAHFADSLAASVRAVLQRAPVPASALVLAAGTGVLGAIFSLTVLDGNGNLIDSFAQLLQARFIASGVLAGPTDELNAFWAIQNSLFTERGWVSHYPPGHALILAAFIRLGVPWLAGPLLMAVTVCFSVLTVARLMPQHRALAILGGALLAASPFFIAVGASYMNHVTVAAFTTVGAYAVVRCWQDHAAWGVLAGACFAAGVAVRPLSTVVMAVALCLLVPRCVDPAPALGRWVRRTAVMALGALPIGIPLMAYNNYFFGNPFRFGYAVAMGPSMHLGFGVDPWGNVYGLREAVAYTGADMMALGISMFEGPLSALLVIGLFLLAARRIERGEAVLLGWALAPVAANFFYWHHGNFMGPRMVHEALPAWTHLFTFAAAGLVSRSGLPERWGNYRPRSGTRLALGLSVAAGLVVMTPQRLASFGGDWHDIARTPMPEVSEPAIVFVHDAWTSRITMTLIGAGYRLDRIETMMRQNPTCQMHHYATAVAAGDSHLAAALIQKLDTVPGRRAPLPLVEISPGNLMRLAQGERLEGDCAAQASSDRAGIVDIAPMLWRAAPHGAAGAGHAMIARDLGPHRNQQLLAAYPHRRPYVYMMMEPGARAPSLVPYAEGMRLLWGQ